MMIDERMAEKGQKLPYWSNFELSIRRQKATLSVYSFNGGHVSDMLAKRRYSQSVITKFIRGAMAN